MRLVLSKVLFAALGLGAVTTECIAQQTSAADTRTAALESLRVSRWIRIHVQGGGVIEGRVLGVGRDSLFVATSGGEQRLPIAALDSWWVRGRAAKTGAIVGAIPGVIGGTGFGILYNAAFCANAEWGDDPCLVAIPISAVVVGGVGAGIGALIGAGVPKWHRKFPPRPSAGPVVTLSAGPGIQVGLSLGVRTPLR